jgi:ankyrin repeat protein
MKPTKALANAAASGELKTMRAMLKKDGSLAQDWQPIMDACLAGQAEAVALLLESGADPNVKSKSAHQYRPLHRTVEYKKTMPKHDGHQRTVDVLLEAGADPLMQGSYWCISAIAVCATGDSREFLPALVARAPRQRDIFQASVLGETARVRALLKKDKELAVTPDEGTRIWTSEHGWTPMMYCARSHVGATDKKKERALAEIAQALIDHGATPDGCVDMALGNLAVLKTLLDAGGKVADDDSLNHAASDGHFEALEMLMEHGTTLDGTRGTDHHGGYTPLGCAVSCRSIQGATWFLEKGQSPNQIGSKTRQNGLHVAVDYGASEKMLKLLVDHGAKLNQKDSQGHTPLARAQEKKHKKAIVFLEAAGARS